MCSDISSDSEGRIVLVDRIDGFERHADLEHAAQLTRVHHINQDIPCAESTSGQVTVLVRVFHTSVVQIVQSYCKVVRFIRSPFSFEGFLKGSATEIMAVKHRTEHHPGQVVREIELDRLMRIGMEQGRIAHTHRDVAVAQTHITAAQGVQTR